MTKRQVRSSSTLIVITLLALACGSDDSSGTGGGGGTSGAAGSSQDGSSGKGGASGAGGGDASATAGASGNGGRGGLGGSGGLDGGGGLGGSAGIGGGIDAAGAGGTSATGGMGGGDAAGDASAEGDSAIDVSSNGTDASLEASDALNAADATSESADASLDVIDAAQDSTSVMDVAVDQPADTPAEVCVPSGAEDCFNGIDDDCNGAIDCADSACNPIVECVEKAPGFSVGTEVASGAACPAHYDASSTSLNQGLNAPAGCTGCTCTPSLVCASTLNTLSTCGGAAGTTYSVNSATCNTSVNITTMAASADPIVVQKNCLQGGVPATQALTWTTQQKFCETQPMGGGCPSGSVCVAKAPKHCALAASPASCPGNYAPEGGGTWYTGVSDARSCGSSCTCSNPTGGSCGTSFIRAYISTTNCTGSSDTFVQGQNCGLDTPLRSAKVILQGETLPTCMVGNTMTGAATPTGAQTLCCL
jgi:hypothetical protein